MAVLDQLHPTPAGQPAQNPLDRVAASKVAPDAEPAGEVGALERGITLAFVTLPAVALVVAIGPWWVRGMTRLDIVLAIAMFVGVGFGVTIGFHRMLTHHSFRPNRPLKIGLAIAGSMAFEGGPIGWVADHRCHHRFSDRVGDPHSPRHEVVGLRSRVRGLAHAHVGWLFDHAPSSHERYAHDLLADPDLVMINRLFPLWCGLSLALPFGLGYLLGGGIGAALSALLWAGGVRVFVLHHVTWSINSICHTFGARPFRTKDRSGNVAGLAIVSFGESWHNGHHALPRSARHGLLPHQWDPSARLIRGFEQLGWATAVVWPTASQIQAARGRAGRDEPRGRVGRPPSPPTGRRVRAAVGAASAGAEQRVRSA
jgi:stearoyl-CoA desaturase (delta-9 desaturase)